MEEPDGRGGSTVTDLAKTLSARGHGLVLPRSDDEAINRYVAMHSGNRGSVERRPFPRQVDFWAFSIASALAMDVEPRRGTVTSWGKVFIYTSQGILDSDLSAMLTVVAVAKLGHTAPDVGDPRRIVELANRLAGAGCPLVLQKLAENSLRTTPLDRVIELGRSLQERVQSS